MNKVRIDDLAILGGPILFDERLHVGRPNIGNRRRLFECIDDLLDRRWLTNRGTYVQQFEARMAGFLGVDHVVATCNGTLGLEIAARAMDLHGEVIVPSFTFIATPHAFQWLGITPVFCDVDPATHNMDPDAVERLITLRTTGIVGVHLWGRPCNTEALADIARTHDLRLIFDAAHAFGCSHNGRMIGNFGDAEVFSFQATKFFNTFEGGAVATNDHDLARRVRLMKNFGFAGLDEVVSVGTNAKMTEVSAAMGLTSFDNLDELVETNRVNYRHYQRGLEHVPGIRMMLYDEGQKCNFQYIVLEIEEPVAGIGRDELQRVLWAENILARRYFHPGCHRLEPYASRDAVAGVCLPQTEALAQRVLSLPTGTAISLEDVDGVCELIRFAISHAAELKARFPAGFVAPTCADTSAALPVTVPAPVQPARARV